ncbi:type VI secretion system secreted protein VgrG [Devosia sp. UYZn731]|uniref:type VI secretion system Vgr family protein n=1 Tax=Devosia sp. UYZn731 TaxID=3156345 RepID=UPI003394C22D
MADYEQTERLGELLTPIGSEKLVLNRFAGEEAISEPFRFELTAISKDNNSVNFDPGLGNALSVRITSISGEERFFTGTLVEASYLGVMHAGHLYSLVLRPWFWVLTNYVRSRVFHEMSLMDIVRYVFSKHGSLADFEDRLQGSYPQIEYAVQYQESDFAFISRLLEAHGIGYFFEFADKQQKMILADVPGAYPVAPGGSRPFSPIEDSGKDEERFSEWWPRRSFATAKFVRNDYDFRNPNANLLTEQSGSAGYTSHSGEEYIYPYNQSIGEKIGDSWGTRYSEAGRDAGQSLDHRATGQGDCVTLAPGMKVTVKDFPNKGASQEYLVLRAIHQFSGNAYRSNDGEAAPYGGQVEALSTKQAFAPQRVTPRPRIASVQTGRIAGDDEIDTDEFGRVKVHFHWMREDEGEAEGRSMWCRVAQVWSGPQWGGQFIPRKGMEVLVQFLDGDPDQPVVVGTLYNGDNKHPFEVPAEKDTSGWRSRSVYGGPDNFNEISMRDTLGNELLFAHAERDLHTEVEKSEERDVGASRTTNINDNDTTGVGIEYKLTAGEKITLEVGTSSIVMDRMSITIKSTNIQVIASGNLQTTGGALAEHKGGVLVISAGLVQIN